MGTPHSQFEMPIIALIKESTKFTPDAVHPRKELFPLFSRG
jgi:hypothetical protein